MSVHYFKRYRMEVDLRRPWSPPPLPVGFRYGPWGKGRVEDHVEVMLSSFSGEIDADVFHCLGDPVGCSELMHDIARRPGFMPESTWLVEHHGSDGSHEICAAIQGVRVTPRYGGIQNVGVAPWRRGLGLGKALVQAALFGFQAVGLQRAFLEVTAENAPALRLYESLGFRRTKTLYKAVELAVG